MDNKAKKTDLWVFIVAVSLLVLVGCGAPEKKRKQIEPYEPLSEITQDSTIGSLAEAFSYGKVAVEGYGIVAGLNGTGSSECPPQIRTYLKKYILKNVPTSKLDIDEFIDSSDTSVVHIYGVIPEAVSKNQYFDLQVNALPGSQTTSLKGSWLYESDLKVAGSFGVTLKVLASAKGPVYIDTLGDAIGDEKTGYILAGGTALQEYRVVLALRKPDFKIASLIRNRINERFGNNIAKATSQGIIELKIPPKYRHQKKRFLQILSATYLVQTEESTKQRAANFVRKLAVEPDKGPTEITIEAIGNQCLSKLAALLELSDQHIRLRAARCMLNLGSDQGLNALRQIAMDKNSPYRIEAIETITASASRNDASALVRSLLKDEDFNIVKVAYEQLRKLNDIAITQKLIGRNFYLEQIPIIKQKYIMVYRSDQPRVVIFGAPIYCKENIFIESEDGNIILNAPAGQKYVSIIRKHPKRPNVLVKLKSSFELSDIITTLCEESVKRAPQNQTGLNISYGEMISLLKQMVDKGAIKDENVQFKAGPMPKIEQISRNY